MCTADEKAGEKDNMPPPGFTALFNGKDLTNWQGLIELPARAKMSPEKRAEEQKKANDKYLPHWTVTDGVLLYDGKGQSLQTVKDYGNFELYVDWKIGPKGDSGIYLRGNPQVQIWDNPIGSGGLYNNQKNPSKPLKVADRPVGEWNTFHIIMKGDQRDHLPQRREGGGRHAAGELLGEGEAAAGQGADRITTPRRPSVVQKHLPQGTAGLIESVTEATFWRPNACTAEHRACPCCRSSSFRRR